MQNSQEIKKFLSELNIENILNIEEDLGSGYVRLKISEAERRQALQDIRCVEDIIVELLRNSRDAKSKNIFIGTKKVEDKKRIIHFIDDGVGIPKKFQGIIFESRVTSKLEDGIKDPYGFHGRGMALFSIKLNVEEVKITYSEEGRGASFYLDIDLNKVTEKKDQSIMPQIIKTDGNLNIIGGVNNIVKTIIEFQMQNRDINFYYGTPTQILATMRKNLKKQGKYSDYPKFDDWKNFYKYINQNVVKVTEFAALTENYVLMEEISKNIFNMDISQRSIQRVIYNEIQALEPVGINSLSVFYENGLETEKIKPAHCEKDNHKRTGNIEKKNGKISLYDEIKLASRFKDEEIRCIINTVERKIREIGKKYFITLGDIAYKRENNVLKITIELKEKN